MLFPLILAASVVAVFGATIYWAAGNLGPPASRRRQQQRVVNGFILVAGVLLGTMLVGLLVVGIGIAFFRVESTLITSKAIAGVLAAAALAVIALLIQRWAKYFAGWMAFGVLNSLIIAFSGHALNRPGLAVSRPFALAMGGLFAITVAATIRFADSDKLKTFDKLALLFWVLTFAIGANTERFMLVAFGAGCAGLVGAWLHNRKN